MDSLLQPHADGWTARWGEVEVPLTVTEFSAAALSYPIIFVGNDKTPVAVMGVRQNENEYIDATGQPDPDTYLPAFVRRYPFVFMQADTDGDYLLAIDAEARQRARALMGRIAG